MAGQSRFCRLLWLCFCLWLAPLSAAEYQIVSAPEVKRMQSQGVLLINTLSSIEYELQHIAGSINIPVNRLADSERLPADRGEPLIFYCMGVRCPYSERASALALEQGYRRVYWFRGGIPEWHRYNYPLVVNEAMAGISVAKLSPEEVEALRRRRPELAILDVRPRWWRPSQNFLAGTTGIPLIELEEKREHLSRGRPLLITDGAMLQSLSAAKYLAHHGYEVVGILKGGIERWEKERYPTVPADEVTFP